MTLRLPKTFRGRLALILVVGFAVRLAYILWLQRVGTFMVGDSWVYHQEGLQLAAGEGWVNPALLQLGIRRELAMHPPAYPLWLGGWSWLGVDTTLGHQLVTIPIGLATITAIAFLGRTLHSPAAGLVAAAIAALHPSIWSWEGMILQEPMAILAATLLTLAMLRLVRTLDWQSVALAGLAAGFAPLTRAELVAATALGLLVVLIAHRSLRALTSTVIVGVMMCALIAPWAVHNSMRFSRAVPLSNGFGVTLAATHCPAVTGEFLGYWSLQCAADASALTTAEWLEENPDAPTIPNPPTEIRNPLDESGTGINLPERADFFYPDLDEAEVDARMRANTLEWMADHPGFVVKSVAARLGRVAGVYRPLQQMRLDEFPEGRKRPVVLGAWAGYYALLPFVLFGGWWLARRRWRDFVIVVAPVLAAMAAISISFGNTRYRALAEPAMIALASIALLRTWEWFRRVWNDAPSQSEEPLSTDEAAQREHVG